MADTVFDTFAEVARRQPQADFLCTEAHTAQAYGIAPGTMRYGDVLVRIEALRDRYAAAGYGLGHRAGLLLENRPDFFLHWFALNALGVSVVPINADLRSAELSYLVEHSEMILAVCLPERVADLQAAASAQRPLVVITPDSSDVLTAASVPSAQTTLTRDTECALLYTSGTTGRPKGCVLSNDYFLLAGEWYARIGGLCSLRKGEERLITPLPLSHMNAMAYSAMAMVVTGGCLIQLDRFHPRTWWDSVRASQATVVHYLGVMPAMLLSAQISSDDRKHRVRFGFGAGVDKRQHAAFESRFGFPLLEAWAMTETGAGAVVIANHAPRLVGVASFGRAGPAVDVRLVLDDGLDAAVDEPGELWVRSASSAENSNPRKGFFTEYLKDPAATAEAWEQGWFHTGDLVKRDAQGNLYFVDRKKNVIRRSGENISAVEVESVLAQHPRVKAVAVAATPDEVRGDEVLACVVLHEAASGDASTLATEITQFALDQLAYYKAPGFIAFVDELPLTVSQKIQRAQLKLLAAGLPGERNCIDTRHLKRRQT
jgi:acyl-CoA synthetase (AMP-forming)/AMP-acid ligase II